MEVVKSYQRGKVVGKLLYPPVNSDLRKMLDRYSKDRFYAGEGYRDNVWLRPLLMQAFGCLSHAVVYCHDHNTPYNKNSLDNILFEKFRRDNRGVRFLWCEFNGADVLDKRSRISGVPDYGPDRRDITFDVLGLGYIFLELLRALVDEVLPMNALALDSVFPDRLRELKA